MARKNLVTIIFYSLLALIFTLSLGVRIFRLGESPPSLNWDEASLGYNAYSIYKTGKDEYSRVLPLSLRSFDDYKPALSAYLIIPFLKFISLSDVTVRLPSAILGSLLTISVGVIGLRLSRSHLLALCAAVLVSFEPWSIHFSRVAFESNVGTSLLYISLALFVASLRKNSYFLWSMVFAILAMYAYHAHRIIALPILASLTWIFRDSFRFYLSRNWRKVIFWGAILLLPLMLDFLTAPITSRLTSTNIFRLWPFIPTEFSPYLYSPIYTLLWHLTGQFLAYFSPGYLFIRGSFEPGQYVPTLGLLNIIEFPLWLLGFGFLIRARTFTKFLIPILLLAPLPAIITWNWFSVVRTLSIYPAFALVTALGVYGAIKVIGKIKVAGIIAGGLLLALYIPSVIYTTNTELLYSSGINYGDFQPGFEKAVPFLFSIVDSYDKVIIDSPHIAPYIFLLFYGQYDPALYQSQAPRRIKNSGTESIPFAKFEFREINWEADRQLKNTLFMGPTVRLPDYLDSDPQATILGESYDILGYISMRIVATNP